MPALKIKVWYPQDGMHLQVVLPPGDPSPEGRLCIPCFGWAHPLDATVIVRLLDHGEGLQTHSLPCKPVTVPPFKADQLPPHHFTWFTDLHGLEAEKLYTLVATATPTPELVYLGYNEPAAARCSFMVLYQTSPPPKDKGKQAQSKGADSAGQLRAGYGSTVTISYPAANSTIRPNFSAYGFVNPTTQPVGGTVTPAGGAVQNNTGVLNPPPFPYNWCLVFNNNLALTQGGPPPAPLYTVTVQGTDAGAQPDSSANLSVQTSG